MTSLHRIPPVIIVDRGGRLDLAATRLLGGHGVPVHLLLSRGRTAASTSRWCRMAHAIPPLAGTSEEQLIEAICRIAVRVADSTGERPVMMFTWERAMLLIAKHRPQLDSVLRIDLSPLAELQRSIDKREFAAAAEAAGLPVPQSIAVSQEADRDRALAMPLPVFVKPPTNVLWGDLAEKLGITEKGARVDSRARLDALLSAFLAAQRPAIVQEYVDGPDFGHASVHVYREPDTGRIRAVCTVRRARIYPPAAGLACFLISEPFDELVAPSLKAIEIMGLTGTMSVQWKRDTGRGWRILEIGPRLALSMAIGDLAGINIPAAAHRSLSGIPFELPKQRYGRAWIDLSRDRVSMRTYRQNGEWSIAGWLWSLRRVRRCAFFSLRDSGPFIRQLRYGSTY